MNNQDINNIITSAINRLNKIRTDKHISFAEIARKTGNAESSVKRVLTGDSKNASVAMLLGIGCALNLEVSDIFHSSELAAVARAKENEVATAVAVAETAERIATANEVSPPHTCENCERLEFYKNELKAREAWIEKLILLSYENPKR